MAIRSLFTLLLAAAILCSIMAAQPVVQIQPSTLDLAATGVHLVPLDDIGHQGTIEAILGEDRAKVAPVLPYGALIVNGSAKKITAMAVSFRGFNAQGLRRRLTIELTAYHGAISPIPPGASLLFTPVSLVNQYLTLDSIKRKEFLPGSGSGPHAGVSIGSAPDLPTFLQQRISILPAVGDAVKVEIYLNGVAFDDDTYAGSDQSFGSFKEYRPTLHR